MSAMFGSSFGSRFRTAAIAVAAFASAQGFPAPASAGLLDFLFGRPQPQPVMVAPDPAIAKPARRVIRDEPRGPRTYVAPEVVPGPLGRFLRDPSLRRGDVVATPNGLMIFQGRGGAASHSPSDFAPIAKASGVTGARRSDLINLDRTVRATNPNIEYVVAKPEPKAIVVANRNEPRGGFITPANETQDSGAMTEAQ